jgi:hypothetical protein
MRKNIRGMLNMLAIVVIMLLYVGWMFAMLFRKHEGVWYNCMHAKGNEKAMIACGTKEDRPLL